MLQIKGKTKEKTSFTQLKEPLAEEKSNSYRQFFSDRQIINFLQLFVCTCRIPSSIHSWVIVFSVPNQKLKDSSPKCKTVPWQFSKYLKKMLWCTSWQLYKCQFLVHRKISHYLHFRWVGPNWQYNSILLHSITLNEIDSLLNFSVMDKKRQGHVHI